MKVFWMMRKHDESGVSGTGLVLKGVVFDDGTTVVHWVTKKQKAQSIGIFKSYQDFKKIHITCHPKNKTEIIWRYGS